MILMGGIIMLVASETVRYENLRCIRWLQCSHRDCSHRDYLLLQWLLTYPDFFPANIFLCGIQNYDKALVQRNRTLFNADAEWTISCSLKVLSDTPDSKVHVASMGPTWVLSAPDGPHVGPMTLAIKGRHENSWVFVRDPTLVITVPTDASGYNGAKPSAGAVMITK